MLSTTLKELGVAFVQLQLRHCVKKKVANIELLHAIVLCSLTISSIRLFFIVYNDVFGFNSLISYLLHIIAKLMYNGTLAL